MDRLKLKEKGCHDRKIDACESMGITLPTLNKMLIDVPTALKYSPKLIEYMESKGHEGAEVVIGNFKVIKCTSQEK